MKNKLFNFIVIFISFIILIELFINKSIVYSSIMYSLNMFVNSLIPAMFPFFVISNILINYNITNFIPVKIKCFFKKIFNITDNMLEIFLLSILSGIPTNAIITRNLYDRNLINDEEANHILMFSNFPNPMFVLTTVGVLFLHNEKVGLIILISHYLSNIFVGMVCKRYFNHKDNKIDYLNEKNIYFGSVFINSIKKSIDTILLICGIVTIFMILSTIIVNIFNLNIYNSAIIKGIFELTIGIEAISKLNIPLIYKSLIISSFLSFGGLSVHMQVTSQFVDTNIRYKYFFIGRIIQMISVIIINFILFIIFCNY